MIRKNKFKVYALAEYLDQLQNMNLADMQKAVAHKLESLKAEIKESQLTGAHDKLKDTFKFYKDLRELHYFLIHKEFSETLNPYLIKRFRWIIEKLIRRGELDRNVLPDFGD